MNTYLDISLSELGLVFDSTQIYFELSWSSLALIAVLVVAYKIYKIRKDR